MPEGHSIHRLAGQHHRWLAGQRLQASSPQGRFAAAEALAGRQFERAQAWGKHLFHHWDGDAVVHIHLGLFGRFRNHRPPVPPPRDTVRLRLEAEDRSIDLTGPTTCELLTSKQTARVLARLGPDPLRADADPDTAWTRMQRRRIGIGQALMDQSLVAGIGNIYRAELLLAHGIHPLVPARSIDHATWLAVWDTLRRWMQVGVKTGRIITVANSGERGRAHERLMVYGRDVCRLCNGPTRHWTLAARTVWACERCQPRSQSRSLEGPGD